MATKDVVLSDHFALHLARYLKVVAPARDDNSEQQTLIVVDHWKMADYMCKNYVLVCLANSMYNVCCSHTTTKALWDSLQHKYITEDAGVKNWIIGRFLDYKMVDSKTVVSQVQELIIHDIYAENMNINESFQVAGVIEKLPPGWKDFKN